MAKVIKGEENKDHEEDDSSVNSFNQKKKTTLKSIKIILTMKSIGKM